MARAMYEYTKSVLEKVSFNSYLFNRELKKAFKQLLPYEVKELLIWLEHFIENKPQLHLCTATVLTDKKLRKL